MLVTCILITEVRNQLEVGFQKQKEVLNKKTISLTVGWHKSN